ncbi:MAG TPA: tetratricopeptide repeat protein [Thermoanaerobaculia bacterium]|jgi:Tfp pilus assembly protein PilF
MKRVFAASTAVLVAFVLMIVGCRSGGGDVGRAETQRQFGVRMAKMNLWREAAFRFRRATEIDPNDAMAHNNLAVALEANGDLEAAAKEYREALRLDRGNQYIQKNYSRFVEFTNKSKKKPAKGAATTTTSAAAPSGATVSDAAPPTPATPIAQPAPTETTATTVTSPNPPMGGI